MRWLDEKVSDMGGAEYQAAAEALGRALVADGATAQWLLAELEAWQAVSPRAPALIDLVSKRPQCGYNTLSLVQLSAMQSLAANDTIETRSRRVESALRGNAMMLIRRLWPDRRRFEDMKKALEKARASGPVDPQDEATVEIAAFAYDHIRTPSPEAFDAAMHAFTDLAGPVVVRDALRIGARDGLYDAFEDSKRPNFALLNGLRGSVILRQVLEQLFGEAAGVLISGIDNELIRVRNSRVISIQMDIMHYPLFGRAPARQIFATPTPTELEWPALATMALVPAEADLIALIPFPRPSRGLPPMPNVEFRAGGIMPSRNILGGVRRTVSRGWSAAVQALNSRPPAERATAAIGRALAMDGVTRDNLIEALGERQQAGMEGITLADLLPNRAARTFRRLRDAANHSGAANQMARTYRYRVEGNIDDTLMRLIRALGGGAGSLGDTRVEVEARGAQGDVLSRAAQYAYDHVLSEAPDDFAAAIARFEGAEPGSSPGSVRKAMQGGARDRLYDLIAHVRCGRERSAEVVELTPAAYAPLRLLFGDDFGVFERRLEFEMSRLETAREIGFDADPLIMAQTIRSSGGFPAVEVAQAIMSLAISPLTEAGIADIPIA